MRPPHVLTPPDTYTFISHVPTLRFANRWERYRELAKTLGLSREARKRLEWFLWYETTGKKNARATCRHFGIPPKTFYARQKRFDETNLRSLEERSHRPHRVRSRTITPEEESRVVQLRMAHLRYSKMKLAVLYAQRYGTPISSWKIQKVIEKHRLYPHPQKAARTAAKRRRAQDKKRIAELQTKPRTGFLLSLDTIVVTWWGQRRYLLTAIDRFSRLAFARLYRTHSSLNAADFLRRLHTLLDGQIVNVHTDNGSEFHKRFEEAARDLKLTHWWSRTKTPKDNAVCERFNRTIQEEFISQGNAIPDLTMFHRKLAPWLEEYNFKRPHAALGYRTPIEVACPDRKVLPIYSSHTHT
jgi:transposase InsO family protein